MNTFHYLALGDSYTIGEQVEFKDNLPHQLIKLWSKNEPHSLKVVAKTGWTTQDLIHAIQQEHFKEHYDLISLLIGVNNQYQQLNIEEFKKDLIILSTWITQRIKDAKKVIYISIPDWGQTPFGRKHELHTEPATITFELQEYNRIIKDIAQQHNFQYIDLFQLSRQQGQKLNHEYLTKDLLHYNAKAYSEWSKIIYHALK